MGVYQGNMPETTNREDYDQSIEINDNNGDPADLTGIDFTCVIADPTSGAALLTGTTDGGEIATVDNTITISFTLAQMTALCPKQYKFGLTYTDGTDTKSLIAGTINVIDGVVPV
jgi:hypothetical protein